MKIEITLNEQTYAYDTNDDLTMIGVLEYYQQVLIDMLKADAIKRYNDENKQTEKELLLSLNPNNPEHVRAYAESQGRIAVDTARKMLMMHQDEFVKQMKSQPVPPVTKPSPAPSIPNDGHVELLKEFAHHIGKVIGEMTVKIESLYDTVSAIQNDVNDIKKKSTIHVKM